MSDKKITPNKAIAALEEARRLVWQIQQENPDADIEKSILALDDIIRRQQTKWEAKV